MPETDSLSDTFVLHSSCIITPEGQQSGSVFVEAGTIKHIQPDDRRDDLAPQNTTHIDLGSLALLPGFIDAHVHLNAPRPADDPWEGFETGTRAAATGGITTVLDMPLNSLPVTTDLSALKAKRDAAAGRLSVDVGLYAGLVPGAMQNLAALLDAGVHGVKCFLCDSGLEEFPATDHETLAQAMRLMAEHPAHVPLLVHAERTSKAISEPTSSAQRRKHSAWLASRPPSFEQDAVKELLDLADATGCSVHVVHVADAGTAELIRAAKAAGLPVTAETCPHYLVFCNEEIPDGDTRYKCAPPIRDAPHREALWDALLDGTLDWVASDHSPCPPTMKYADTGDFFDAWGGIASLQLGPAITWTLGRRRGMTLSHLADWWCHAPAKRFGVAAGIVPSQPANLVAFDPDTAWSVDPSALYHRHRITPYAGMAMTGKAQTVWLRGRRIVDRGAVMAPCHGQVLQVIHHLGGDKP